MIFLTAAEIVILDTFALNGECRDYFSCEALRGHAVYPTVLHTRTRPAAAASVVQPKILTHWLVEVAAVVLELSRYCECRRRSRCVFSLLFQLHKSR